MRGWFLLCGRYQNIGVFYPTGNGIDWGIHLARMGVSVSAVSVVGKDEYGDKMREALAAEGFDISHLRVEDGDTSVMLMALKDGVDRVHLEAIDGVMETYRPNEDDRAFILEHDIIHTDLFGNCLDLLPEWHDAGKTVVMDFSVFSQDPEYACEAHFPYVDYAFYVVLKRTLRSCVIGYVTYRSWGRGWQLPRLARREALPLTANASMSAGSYRRRRSLTPWAPVTRISPGLPRA